MLGGKIDGIIYNQRKCMEQALSIDRDYCAAWIKLATDDVLDLLMEKNTIWRDVKKKSKNETIFVT